jgi:hypothetical protein
MSRTSLRRAAVLTILAPLLTAGIVTTAGPASAIPFEGDPTPSTCLRVVAWPGSGDAASTRPGSHRYVAILVPRIDC